MYFYSNLYMYYALLFISGVAVAKNICVYIYMTEVVPEKYQILVGSVCLSNDPVIALCTTSFYFLLGGKEWKTVFLPTLVFPIISLLWSFFIPESPRYLYAKKDFPALRKNLKTIAHWNGSSMDTDYNIDEEVKMLMNREKLNSKSKFDFQIFEYYVRQP